MDIALITSRPEALGAFCTALERRGIRVEVLPDGPALRATLGTWSWGLAIVDGVGRPFRGLLESLLEMDAALPTAVLTDLEPEAFHEASEGLGVLTALPPAPGAPDVEGLLDRLQAVGGWDGGTGQAQERLDDLKHRHHPHCVVCWDRHPFGLKVDFRTTGEHAVEGRFACGKSYEGYRNVVHGGIISSLLDGAMASCILAKGIEAYTVELKVRFRGAVETGVPAVIRGEWLRGDGPIHLLHANLTQGNRVCASARAKFFEGSPDRPGRPMPEGAGLRALLSQARKRLT